MALPFPNLDWIKNGEAFSGDDPVAPAVFPMVPRGVDNRPLYQLLANITFLANNLVPVGGMIDWSGTDPQIPATWLKTNGQAVSRTTYATLFALIGTTYGVGDGSTTFNVPTSVGKIIKS